MSKTPRVIALIVMFLWYFPISQMFFVLNNTTPGWDSICKLVSLDFYSAFWMFWFVFLWFIENPRKFCIGFLGHAFIADENYLVSDPGIMIFVTCFLCAASPIIWFIILAYWGYLLATGGFPKFWRVMFPDVL